MPRRVSSLSCKAPVAAMRCWWINWIGPTHQVVVRRTGKQLPCAGISAATILGDGSVALIVDVSALQTRNRKASDGRRAIANGVY